MGLPGQRGSLGWLPGDVWAGGVGLTATHSAARAGGGHDHAIRGPGCSVTHGGLRCQEGMVNWPGDLLCRRGW
jgi:hypothetical protein